MIRNGPIAKLFNALVMGFMLAPLLIVCLVAFTPENTLTISAVASAAPSISPTTKTLRPIDVTIKTGSRL